ncbi:MAG TPA: S8 family serine peptidase [Clostridia bacterium]|nr:S8 family serine peptidase [Clostridia bacterium]
MNLSTTVLLLWCCAGAQPASGAVARWGEYVQLPAIEALEAGSLHDPLPSSTTPGIPGRRMPKVTYLEELHKPGLDVRTVPLPLADTQARAHFRKHAFGRLQHRTGVVYQFNPEVVLVKFRHQGHVSVLRVPSGMELEAVLRLGARTDIDFAELDLLQERAFSANDPLLSSQWHHGTLGSPSAWDRSRGVNSVRIAIVDAPFQMDHPDLAANADPGWDVVANEPIIASSGIDHSTHGAGCAAGVLHNGQGIAGMINCRILPINVNGFTSELCLAVYWAASNNVRVVNISWTGADSDALNAAAAHFSAQARGLVIMAGVNSPGFLNYPNQPDLWCVSMTDAAENPRSAFGYHIDFAAPGWQVFSTRTGGAYGYDSGSSYAAPIVAGIVAALFSSNPRLGPGQVIDLLKTTARDKGDPGWDMWFGWGRVDFQAASAAVASTLPIISGITVSKSQVTVSVPYSPGLNCSLWRSASPASGTWERVAASISTNAHSLSLVDPAPSPGSQFYRIMLQ